jgi:ParB/RepB/Spo0J family partition protein
MKNADRSSRRQPRAKKLAARTLAAFRRQVGPQAEYYTTKLLSSVILVPTDKILEDPSFVSFRKSFDPARLAALRESIRIGGLRTPITVTETEDRLHYHLRTGALRLAAVRCLKWTQIPALVLPFDTPDSEEYWSSIMENSVGQKLSSCELARYAKLMRDRFKVSASEFAARTAHTTEYVKKLLKCVDRLPAKIFQWWQLYDLRLMPFDMLCKLACENKRTAIGIFNLWIGSSVVRRKLENEECKPPGRCLTTGVRK